MKTYPLFIDGVWRPALAGRTMASVDPYRDEPWALVQQANADDVNDAVLAARSAFDHGPWPALGATARAALLRRLGDIVARDATELARMESRSNGRLIREMEPMWLHMPEWLHYFAGLIDKLEGRVIPSPVPNHFVYTQHEPLGVVAAITPWNAPGLLLMFKLAPALAAGCTVVVKPSEFTSVSALELADRFVEAGFPKGVYNVVTGLGDAGAALAAHPGVDKIAFTGSTATGITIAKAAAANLTRLTLELGGKSPNIVFEDAEFEAAATGVITGIFSASGQACFAGSRLIVHEAIRDRLLESVVAKTRLLKLGDPLDPATEMGPLANPQQFSKVERLVQSAKDAGATVQHIGPEYKKELSGKLFYPPTIVTNVRPEMRIAKEEIFGPVLCVFSFRTDDEAIALANDTAFGLAAGVWTRDVARAHRIARRIRAGSIWINTYRVFGSSVPFGGFKASGLGRENGIEAMHEYTETKAVWIGLGTPQ